MSVEAGRMWWFYGQPSVEKSATAWQLFAEVLRGEQRGSVDIDQVGMSTPSRQTIPGGTP